jgi:DNA-binding SARP family transcriptional activator
MLTFRLFGSFVIESNQQPVNLASQKGRSLLSYLLYHADIEHTRPQLCDLFWPDLDESTARRRLSYTLWSIGRTIGDSLIVRNGDRLYVDRKFIDEVDVHVFENALDQAAIQMNDKAALPFLHQAVDRYTEPLLVDDYNDWVIIEQERLRERYLQALQKLIAAQKAMQNFEQALCSTQALIRNDPLREEAYQEAIQLYQDPRPSARRTTGICTAFIYPTH